LEDSRDGKNLRRVADGGERFVGFRKVVDNLDDPRVEAKVFDRATAGDHERVVVFGFDLIESGVQREIMTALLGVRLVAFEIVDAGRNELAGFLARADSVNGVADHQKRLVWNHHLVVLYVIANEHENGFLGHVASAGEIVTEDEECAKRDGYSEGASNAGD
jgi:hypothetical protein